MSSIRSFYEGWHRANTRLIEGVARLSDDQLALRVAGYWPIWAIAGHAANNFAALLGSAGFFVIPLSPVPGLFTGLALAGLGLVWAMRARPRGEPRAPDLPLQPDPGPADA